MWAPNNVTWYTAQLRHGKDQCWGIVKAAHESATGALLFHDKQMHSRERRGWGSGGWELNWDEGWTGLNVYYDYGYVMRRIFHLLLMTMTRGEEEVNQSHRGAKINSVGRVLVVSQRMFLIMGNILWMFDGIGDYEERKSLLDCSGSWIGESTRKGWDWILFTGGKVIPSRD